MKEDQRLYAAAVRSVGTAEMIELGRQCDLLAPPGP
jgi:hypothetical protein